MKLSDEDLNILLDGTEDTKIRIKREELKESTDYKIKVEVLNKRIKRELKRRQKKFVKLGLDEKDKDVVEK